MMKAARDITRVQLDLLANEVLTLIEIREARLLNWGFVDVTSDLDAELPAMLERLPPLSADLWTSARAAGVQPAAILRNLCERKLLFKGRTGYRTRFAEAVRLLFHLRQRFSCEDWQIAPRLVSDLKIHLQRRRYPKRDIPAEELLDELKTLALTPRHLEAVRRLLENADGSSLQLARFQKEATLQQFRNLQERSDRGLVIGAGTGAGKTKAFYIPALAEIAATLTPDPYVRALAIYPRVELLKDQLAEAFAEVRKLDERLRARRTRPISVGAYYGDTPASAATFLAYPPEAWTPASDGSGWVCPFFFCPNPDCIDREMTWRREDIRREATANESGEYGRYARLQCRSCGTEVGSQHLALTREQMSRRPPDILFTTTEMLNRRLARASEHHLFGIGTSTPPRLMLLDEIHTYEGLTGAQVAYVLRRWRHARGSHPQHNLCVVGLSATLTDAESFFSRLTGIPLHHIGYIFPREDDLIEEGIEYNIVLKGDPVSGTSLLSTSVQTAMLLGRILDPPPPRMGNAPSISRGAYGHKIFAFTDSLDVINRWYHIEYDAETKRNLSKLRQWSRTLDGEERRKRNQMGQDWWVCSQIGHDLRAPLLLDLTSSQYRGVRSNANLVIATSTLEVGFNDPAVGGVIQHKAPRSLASFLQRKGRAGRTRTMRPWMVVVTSDYGRDRWAFQHAETLFEPNLPPLDLPLDNYYVRKIQASFALMDWLALVLKRERCQVDVWELLSSGPNRRSGSYRADRMRVCELLEEVLQGTRLPELRAYLEQALGFQKNSSDLLAVLWGEPRALLYEVIPTLVRQLESQWQRIVNGKPVAWSDTTSSYPMPTFVPSNLFSDLNLPELTLHIPDEAFQQIRTSRGNRRQQTRRRNDAGPAPTEGTATNLSGQTPMRGDEFMPLAQALIEFAPGSVSKRFARPYRLNEAHWFALPDEALLARGMLSLKDLQMEKDELATATTIDGREYRLYRPRAYTLALIPSDIKSASSARLIWRSLFQSRDQRGMSRPGVAQQHAGGAQANPSDEHGAGIEQAGVNLELAPSSKWRRFFSRIRAYTQANGTWVDVTRLAIGVRTDTLYEGGREVRRTLYFEEESQPAALGFTISVDALRFDFEPLDVPQLLNHPSWPELYHHLGPEYFSYRLHHDVRLREANLSTFDITWLAQLELSMVVAVAVARGCTLAEAAEEVRRNRPVLAERTMRVIFQSLQSDETGDEEIIGRLHKRLMGHIQNSLVQDALRDNTAVLWNREDAGLTMWLQECYAASLGAAVYTSVTQLVPDIEPNDLHLDVDVEARQLWISEATPGGVGFISRIADAIAQRPREFDLQLLDTLQNCDREQLAANLRTVAEMIDQANPPLLAAFREIREVTELPKQAATREVLARTLEEHGVPVTRELIVALNTKFLRPNSGPDSDRLIATVARHWEAEERRIGSAIDLRVMAVAARKIAEIEGHVETVLRRIGGPSAKIDESQIFNLLQSLLWLDCRDSCPSCIEVRQTYQEGPRPSRSLLLTLLDPHVQPVHYGTPGWEQEIQRRLGTEFYAQVSCEQSVLEECKQGLLNLLVEPVEIGFQLFYPVIERIHRRRRQWQVDLAIRELMGA